MEQIIFIILLGVEREEEMIIWTSDKFAGVNVHIAAYIIKTLTSMICTLQ